MMNKWINIGFAMLFGAMVAALLAEAAHIPTGLSGIFVWIIVAAGCAEIVDAALNGPARIALALEELSSGFESRVRTLESAIEKMTRLLEKHHNEAG